MEKIKGNHRIIIQELKKSYEFFMKEVNLDKNSRGYGLVRDTSDLSDEIASIASTRIWICSTYHRSRTSVDIL